MDEVWRVVLAVLAMVAVALAIALVNIYVKANFAKEGRASNPQLSAQCNVFIEYNYTGPWRREMKGGCVTRVGLAYLNSIPGLKTAFGITEDSAIYLEEWGAFCYDVDMSHCPPNMWIPRGKKLTESLVRGESPYISNGQRAVVLGNVYYVYEYYAWYDDDLMRYVISEYFYPQDVRGLEVKVIGTYTPPSQPPPDAYGPGRGNVTIYVGFDRGLLYGGFGVKRPAEVKLNLSTSISITIGAFNVTINTSPYKAWNPRYKPPYVSVRDVSGKPYDWWYWRYKDDDPLNYEVEFYGNP